MSKAILVVPFYKNEHFIEDIGRFFENSPSEKDIFSEILIINDCPDSVQSALLEDKAKLFGFEYIQNASNQGFLLSANIGIKKAAERRLHVVVLNSDTIPFGNCFTELLSVFQYDSMVGCACPRSNNATIANLWSTPQYIDGFEDARDLWVRSEIIKSTLPKTSYVPVVNGFCMAIRDVVIQNFDGFDEDFIPGYEEENEYCLRISQSGYRIAIANHAFIAHLEGRSFSLKPDRSKLMQDHYKMIVDKYPFYPEKISKYFDSVDIKALHLFTVSSENKNSSAKSILIDGRTLTPFYNGTNKVIKDVVREASEAGHKVDLIANQIAFDFHEIAKILNVERIDSPVKYYELGIKIGQPFEYPSLLTVPLYSKVAVNIFFDTIAMDCIHLHDENVNRYWQDLDDLYSIIYFISDHAKEQFEKRYLPVKAQCRSLLLPIELELQLPKYRQIIDWKYTFIAGNNFKHKGIPLALKQLPQYQGHKYVALVSPFKIDREDIIFIEPGSLSNADINSLYQNCERVIFPSFAEGFGYPLVEALQHCKEVICRPLDSLREIFHAVPSAYRRLISFVDTFDKIKEIEPSQSIGPIKKEDLNYFLNIYKECERLNSILSFGDIKSRLRLGYILLRNYSL